MTTTITHTEYIDGQRVTQQTVTYTRSDDLRTLGNLEYQLAAMLENLEQNPEDKNCRAECSRRQEEIIAARAAVDGYDVKG